jgi:hypothetical protein
MRNWLLVCILVSLFACSPALGADVSYIDYEPVYHQKLDPPRPGLLLFSGEIVPGDYGRLLAKILSTQEDFFTTNEIILASNGGDVREAIKIAKLVKSLYSTVVVGPATGRCISACFLIYAAANERESDNEQLIGIHRPYIVDQELASMSPFEAEREQNKVLAQAREYLKGNGVPDYLIEEMFRRSSKDVYWLSADDLTRLGFQSPWFNQYLVAKCDWKGTFPWQEHRLEVITCRKRFTEPAATEALLKAVNEYVGQYGPLPGFHPPGPPEPPPPEAVAVAPTQFSVKDIAVGGCYIGDTNYFHVEKIANGMVTYVEHGYTTEAITHRSTWKRGSIGIQQFIKRVAFVCADYDEFPGVGS